MSAAHTANTTQYHARLPHDLANRLDVVALRTNGTRTSALVLALREGLPHVEAELGVVPPPDPPPRPEFPAWVERWRGRFGSVPNAEIARIEGVSGSVVGKWRGRVGG